MPNTDGGELTSSGGFVDNTEVLEASNLTGILSGLPLTIVKVSGGGYDRVVEIVVSIIEQQILPNQAYLICLLRYRVHLGKRGCEWAKSKARWGIKKKMDLMCALAQMCCDRGLVSSVRGAGSHSAGRGLDMQRWWRWLLSMLRV